ncbi:hypothetical protein B9Z07_28280 [Burkholderia cenocepacia]|uniref:Uncharacterized protein n=2 Tax=Burkholderia cenocepacia TaxID=95486 RepID=A0AAD0J4U7_9BURK|nr:hypothetical protein [Burkholderia cenocepacia]AWG32599.1 hypothetical protein B9Z07_28280 [Burkholderia cenocepacia]PRE33737.1 hypothetical protein C6P63_26540 [Burkholderia cenocepacia]
MSPRKPKKRVPADTDAAVTAGACDIAGSYCLLPPPDFFTPAKAALLISAQLHPDDVGLRADTARCYEEKLFDDLCGGRIIGRDPGTRLPIEYRDLAGAVMFRCCVISETDLNEWLDRLGIGISIGSPADTDSVIRHALTDDELFDEHEKLKNDGCRKCNVVLAKKYGLTVRQVKDRCTQVKKRREIVKTPFYRAT